jgi:hypothetical protein
VTDERIAAYLDWWVVTLDIERGVLPPLGLIAERHLWEAAAGRPIHDFHPDDEAHWAAVERGCLVYETRGVTSRWWLTEAGEALGRQHVPRFPSGQLGLFEGP